jgi:hypothetical protein
MLITIGAIAAAGTMVLAPTVANAAPPASISVNGSTANAATNITGVMKSASAVFAGFNNACSSGSAAGVVNGGTTGIAPNQAFRFTSLTLNCASFIPGTTITLDINACNVGVVFPNTNTATTARTDILTGTATMTVAGVPCATVTVNGAGCTVKVGGTVGTSFNETAKPNDSTSGWTQELTLSGTGLTMSGGTGLCAFVNGSSINLTAAFNFQVAGGNTLGSTGGINFLP